MSDTLIECDLLGQLPLLAAQRWGPRIALSFEDQHWSYADFESRVEALARALEAWGVQAGERVALWLPNRPEIQFLLFAITRIGAIAVPLNIRYKSAELAFTLARSGSVCLISCTRAGPVNLDAILADALQLPATTAPQTHPSTLPPALRTLVMIGDSTIPNALPWETFLARGEHTPSVTAGARSVRASDPALMMFTSGTTGQPKGVLLDHTGLRVCRDRARIMQLREGDVQLTYLPLFHIYAIGYSVLMSFLCGASQVLMDVFNGVRALQLIAQHRVTVLHGFDAHFADLLAAKSQTTVDISSLRFASFATGADATRELALRVQETLCETASSYGLTELWGGFTISPPGATLSQRCEASGLPQPGVEIRIVDPETSRVLPENTIGEIQVRSYARLLGYHLDAEATAQALDAQGWFRTGDAGLLRSDGYLKYHTRYKDMLKVGGENVAPAEIEAVLCQVPGITAAAVVGHAHARLQEVPVAFVVIDPSVHFNETEVIGSLQGRLARYKIPARINVLQALPMTTTGKVQKTVLRERLQNEPSLRP